MILSTSFNTQNVFPNFTLSSPIIVGQGQVVRGLSYLSNGVSSNAIINGYLKWGEFYKHIKNFNNQIDYKNQRNANSF